MGPGLTWSNLQNNSPVNNSPVSCTSAKTGFVFTISPVHAETSVQHVYARVSNFVYCHARMHDSHYMMEGRLQHVDNVIMISLHSFCSIYRHIQWTVNFTNILYSQHSTCGSRSFMLLTNSNVCKSPSVPPKVSCCTQRQNFYKILKQSSQNCTGERDHILCAV